MEKQTGFLLSYIKYGDNDAILHCYTLESGFISFFIKGIYSLKNKKKAFLTPLNELLITVSSHSSISNLITVKKIETINVINEQDINKNTVLFFVADFLNQILKNEQQNEAIYQEIKLLYLNIYQDNFNSHYIFLIKILLYLGINPLVTEEKYLNLEKGIFQNDIDSYTIEEDISKIWKDILLGKITYDYKFTSIIKKKLLDIILQYYRYHFPEFYYPKSLSVICEIFE